MTERKNNRHIPFWIQIASILMLGVIASIGIWHYAEDKNTENFLVKFSYQDGTVIKEETVKKGYGIFPPQIETESVFRGWNSSINNVKNDITANPVLYKIQEQNLFYFNSVYVKEGAKFTLDLYIGGKVSVSDGTLELKYDPEVLKYKKYETMGEINISESDTGVLNISFARDENLNEKTKLATLTFYAKKKDVYSSEMLLSATDVKCISNGQPVTTDFATINNKIFFLQEVE